MKPSTLRAFSTLNASRWPSSPGRYPAYTIGDIVPDGVSAGPGEVVDGVFAAGAYEELLPHDLVGGCLNRKSPGSDHVVDKRQVAGLASALHDYGVAVKGAPQPLEYEDLPAHVRPMTTPVPMTIEGMP